MTKTTGKEYRFATKAIHSGQEPDSATGAVIVPIYATSTYAQESPGQFKGFDEIIVRRKIERDKGSKYFINDKEIRARDALVMIATSKWVAESIY